MKSSDDKTPVWLVVLYAVACLVVFAGPFALAFVDLTAFRERGFVSGDLW